MKKILLILTLLTCAQVWAQDSQVNQSPAFTVGVFGEMPGALGVMATCNNIVSKGKVGLFADANIKVVDSYNGQKRMAFGVSSGIKFKDTYFLGLTVDKNPGFNGIHAGVKMGADIKLFQKKLILSPYVKTSKYMKQGYGVQRPEVGLGVLIPTSLFRKKDNG